MKYRAVKCQTADEACRLLQDLATSQVERQAVPRTLRAVAQWIVDDQTAQQETRAGMGRMMLDAARRVGQDLVGQACDRTLRTLRRRAASS